MKAELKELINLAATDGIITPDERNLIIRKATEWGEDISIVELYINAAVQKFEQEQDEKKKEKLGMVCPHCNMKIPLLTEVCPYCDSVVSVQSCKEFDDLMSEIQGFLVQLKSERQACYRKNKAKLENSIHKAELLYGDNSKVVQLVSEVREQIKIAKQEIHKRQRITMISGISLIGLILAICLAIYFFYKSEDTRLKDNEDARIEAAEQREDALEKQSSQKKQISDQYDMLIGKLESLPVPDANNYEECKRQLHAMQWPDIVEDESKDKDFEDSKRSQFWNAVKGYAQSLYAVYMEQHGIKEYPEEEEDPAWDTLHDLVKYGVDLSLKYY